MCLRGASAVDELLAEFPDAPMRVFVVWEPVLKTDIAPPLASALGLIKDRRAAQYWDSGLALSEDLVRSVNASLDSYDLEEPLPEGFIAWDVVAVFEPDDRWEGDVPVPKYYGGPVANVIEPARDAIVRALRPTAVGAVPAPRN